MEMTMREDDALLLAILVGAAVGLGVLRLKVGKKRFNRFLMEVLRWMTKATKH